MYMDRVYHYRYRYCTGYLPLLVPDHVLQELVHIGVLVQDVSRCENVFKCTPVDVALDYHPLLAGDLCEERKKNSYI